MQVLLKVISLLVLALLAGCMTNYVGSLEQSNASPIYKFVRGEHVILLTTKDITLDSKSFPLADCSTGESYCYKNDQIGFLFRARKYCSEKYALGNLYTFEDKKFRLFTLTPHVMEINFSYLNKDKFLYSYSDWRGLVGIIFNDFNNFSIPDPKNMPEHYNFEGIMKYQYRIAGKHRPFTCQTTKK